MINWFIHSIRYSSIPPIYHTLVPHYSFLYFPAWSDSTWYEKISKWGMFVIKDVIIGQFNLMPRFQPVMTLLSKSVSQWVNVAFHAQLQIWFCLGNGLNLLLTYQSWFDTHPPTLHLQQMMVLIWTLFFFNASLPSIGTYL